MRVKKARKILVHALPILVMIGLIPLVQTDEALTVFYILIIALMFSQTYRKHDILVFSFGFLGMIASEYLFISTGVETFERRSLLEVMPIWLPFLWGYGFIVIRRSLNELRGRK